MRKKLKVLFLQNSPCIRNYKYAIALQKRGIIIDLAYTEKSLAERYPGLSNDVYHNIFKINSYQHLWDLAQNYDLIHSHNEPDTLTVAALASHKPVIHDTHDLISLRNTNKPDLAYFEGIANRTPAGRIYSTEIQKELAFKMYNFEGLSEVFYNYISEDDKPKFFHKKLSDIDGKVHIVYEGGIGGATHRNFHNIFIEFASLGFELHIYPALYLHKTAEIFSPYKNIHYYQSVSPTILMEEMTKYDFGIIPWNVTNQNKLFLDSTIANKLFEYLASGLPVIASEVESYVRFFKENEYGITFREAKEILDKMIILNKIKNRLRDKSLVFSYEQNADKIIEFYHRVIANHYGEKLVEIKKSSSLQKFSKSITILAFVEPKYKQLHNKILGQYNALKSLGAEVSVFLFGKGYSHFALDYPFEFIDTYGRAEVRNEKIAEILKNNKSDFIYFRYPNGYKDGLKGLMPILKKYDNIIFEHNTKEEEEAIKNNHPNALNQEIEFGRRLIGYAKGLVAVTNEIALHQKERSQLQNLQIEVIGNGINVSDYPLAKQQELFDEFDMLFVGYIAIHHGIERIFAGMRDYQGKCRLRLFIAGKSFNASYQEYLIKLTEDFGIKDNVIWLGELSKSELDRFFDIAHIGIGSLGLHRINQPEAATLKTREYLSRGLPLVIDHKDVDIYNNSEFVFEASPDEKPIQIELLINFIRNLRMTNNDIRAFALNNLDWKVKMQKLLDFLCRLEEDSFVEKSDNLDISHDANVIILEDDFDENVIFIRRLLKEANNKTFVFVGNQIIGRTKQLLETLSEKYKIIELKSDEDYHNIKQYLVQNNISYIEKNAFLDGNYRIFRKREEFEDYYKNFSDVRLTFESDLAKENKDKEVFYYHGYCDVCEKESDFKIDWKLFYNGIPGYRERLICPDCGLSSRKRSVFHLIKKMHKEMAKKVLIFEQKGKFYYNMKKVFGDENIDGCEFLGDDIPAGAIINNIRNENILHTSFDSDSFDIVIANDVLEHVPNIEKAVKEVNRILKKNGKFVFTIPFNWQNEKSFQRAEIKNEEIIFYREPHYHKDPLRKEGALVFYDFGWDILSTLVNNSFIDAFVIDSYDVFKGNFGNAMNLIFIAQKG